MSLISSTCRYGIHIPEANSDRSLKSALNVDLFLVITPTIFAPSETSVSNIVCENVTEPIKTILIL
jgi:hypothetical protein